MTARAVLIVDPDDASRNYLARAVVSRGFAVLQASSGREGMVAALQERPDLIIADPGMSDVTGEDFARALRQDETASATPLIALSSLADPARAASCLAAGFSEYIRKSSQAMPALMAALDAVLGPPGTMPPAPPPPAESVASAAVLSAPPPAAGEPLPAASPSQPISPPHAPRQGGLLLTFLSAKGGTGTSSLCANLAMNIAVNEPDVRVAVVDMVLPIGSIAPIVGYEGKQDIVEVADLPPAEIVPEYFLERLVEVEPWRFHLLAGSPDPERSHQLNVGRVPDIVNALRGAYDYVVLDIGRSLSKITMPLIEEADLVVLIVSTDTATVTLTRTLVSYLKDQGVNPQRIYAILNRAVGLEGLTKAEAEKVIGLSINTAMPHLSGHVALANNQHQPLSLKFPRDTVAIILKETSQEMTALAKHRR